MGRLAADLRTQAKLSARTDHGQSPVSDESITGCIAPFAFWLKVVNPRNRNPASCLYVADELVSLGIDIGRNMVRGVSIRMADAYADVVCGCANP